MSNRVLITGGAGFIGSHMAEKIIEMGHEVIIIDNESTGLHSNVPAEATYVRGDVRDPDALEQIFIRPVDVVFHIAGQASTIHSFSDPLDDLSVNVEGTVNVIQKCLEHQVPRLLFASSMTVYGLVSAKPVHEDTPCMPISYYGITKYAAERYVRATGLRFDLDVPLQTTVFRMFNVYGERQRLDNPYQGVMGIFIGNVLRNEPVVIHSDGLQSRDFVYIDDVVDAWIRAWENPEAIGKVFNLGTGNNYAINTLAQTIIEALGYSFESYPIEYQPLRPGDQRHMTADIATAQQVLKWQPQVTFIEGIKRTVTWAQNL